MPLNPRVDEPRKVDFDTLPYSTCSTHLSTEFTDQDEVVQIAPKIPHLVSNRALWTGVLDHVSVYQLQPVTGDGLVLALVRTHDHLLHDDCREEVAQEVLQLVLVLLLHIAALALQFGLTYHLYTVTVEGLEDPFKQGIHEKMQAINVALDGIPPVPLAREGPGADALRLCEKQHALGFTHFMVLSLWSARMISEVSEILNRLAINGLTPQPDKQYGTFLRERDGKLVIAHMNGLLRLLVILLVIIPRLFSTIFLSWTGGILFMMTYTMGALIIPLLTLTYILQIPMILFTGFSSLKFKEKVDITVYQYRNALCYTSKNCQMWGLTVIKVVATIFYVLLIYRFAYGDVTDYRQLCSRYFEVFPQWNCRFRSSGCSASAVAQLGQ